MCSLPLFWLRLNGWLPFWERASHPALRVRGQIYPLELQLNKANISVTEARFLDLHLSVSNGFVSSKIYDKRDDFDFDIIENFPFVDGDVPRRASYVVYISQLIRFARVSNHVTDFNARNKCLTNKLLQQGYRYHKLRKPFLNSIVDTMN